MDKLREEFEVWFRDRYCGILDETNFKLVWVTALDAWKSSRAALVVQLPCLLQPGADGPDDWYLHSSPDGEYMNAEDVISAIRKAGISVKEGE